MERLNSVSLCHSGWSLTCPPPALASLVVGPYITMDHHAWYERLHFSKKATPSLLKGGMNRTASGAKAVSRLQ